MVHSKGSFSTAADALDINQSTVSYTIEGLRHAFADPLFVRQGGKITATVRCTEIVSAAEQILENYADMITPPEFDPVSVEASVRISSNYFERVTVLPKLARMVRAQAPGIHLMMLQSLTAGHEQLNSGEADILLTPVATDEKSSYTRKLFQEKYVCVMDAQNPLARHPLTEETYCGANHVLVTYGNNWRSFYLVELEKKGFDLNRSLSIPSPENLSKLIVGTDLISTVPSRLAILQSKKLITRACPFPAPFDVYMFWTARTHHSKLHQWVRSRIAETVAEMIRKER